MARSRDAAGAENAWASGRPRTAPGSARWPQQRRPQGHWQDYHPPPQLPKAFGRATPAMSAVEAIFRAQYYAAAEPEPIDVQGIYKTLAGEPETWAGLAGPPGKVRLPQVRSQSAAATTAPVSTAPAPTAAASTAPASMAAASPPAGGQGSSTAGSQSIGVQAQLRSATPREGRSTGLRTPRPRSALGALSRHPAGGRVSPAGMSRAPSATADRSDSRVRLVERPKEATSLEAAGLDRELAPSLLERVRQLSASSTSTSSSARAGPMLGSSGGRASPRGSGQVDSVVAAWVIVEICRDCASHDSSLRHDERAYLARYLQLKDAILRSFPVGVSVELLVPNDGAGPSSTGAPAAGAAVHRYGGGSPAPGCRGGGCCVGCSALPLTMAGLPQSLPTANLCGGYSAGYAAGFAAGAAPSRSSLRRESPTPQPSWRESPASLHDWRDGPANTHSRGVSSARGASPVQAAADTSSAASIPRVRIGAFEVYLCCSEPCRLDGGALLNPTRIRRESREGGSGASRRQPFFGLCIASKLRSRAWPAPDAVLTRLAVAMPKIPLRVQIFTELELPLHGAQLAAVPSKAMNSRFTGEQNRASSVSSVPAQWPTSGAPLTSCLDGVNAGRASPAFGGRASSRAEGSDAGSNTGNSSWLDASSIVASGETDGDGSCELIVPACTVLVLHAWHGNIMEPQQREVRVTQIQPPEVFLAETVVQLWQQETAKELIIYCSSPRAAGPSLISRATEGMTHFQGTIDSSRNDQQILQDHSGTFWRSFHDPLDDMALLLCDGWRSATMSEAAKEMHGTGRVVEVARLGVPIVQASLIAPCCKASVPDARISIDGEYFGTTSSDGTPVNCGVRCGDHMLRAEHALAYDGVKIPMTVSGSTTFGLEVKLPLERLRFVCVGSAPGSGRNGKAAAAAGADLWLVGGDLSEWRASGHGPSNDAQVWLWDGELCGAEGHIGHAALDGPLLVQAGVLGAAALGDDHEDSSYSDSSSLQCVLSQALTRPSCVPGPWRVALRSTEAPRGCLVCRLANMAAVGVPAFWVARLASSRGAGSPGGTGGPPRLTLRSTCCCEGFPGAEVLIAGQSCGKTDQHGQIKLLVGGGSAGGLSQATSSSATMQQGSRSSSAQRRGGKEQAVEFRIQGVPPCLLPGGTGEYMLQWSSQEPGDVSLDVACFLWVYWVPPEEEEEEDFEKYSAEDSREQAAQEEEEAEQPLANGTVWIASDSELVPEEARPISGVLECLGSKVPEIQLDGRSMGPFILTPVEAAAARDAGKAPCLLSGLMIHPKAPEGFTYRPREPSPLAERCMELGGCEHQRLAFCPVVVGYLTPVKERSRSSGGGGPDRWADSCTRDG